MKLKYILTAGAVALSGFAQAAAETCSTYSGPHTTALVELYTSEGCDSCPPADQWLSSLFSQGFRPDQVVPLALHVDYWDYIGWKDRFASAAYSARQRRYARDGGASTVYTPGFLLNGIEWRRWRRVSEPSGNHSVAGDLTAGIDDGNASIAFSPPAPYGDGLVAHVAVLGFGLESDVRAGENNGRKLISDFVVLGSRDGVMAATGETYKATLPLPQSPNESDRTAVVVWVSTIDSQTPLQAAGGWLTRH